MSKVRRCGECKRDRPHEALGLCSTCYTRKRKAARGWVPPEKGPECAHPGCTSVPDCDGLAVCSRHIHGALGISYRQLDYWIRRGYLRPAVPRGGGPGHSRQWPAEEIQVALRMSVLVAAGLVPERAASFARSGWPAAEIAPGVALAITSACPVPATAPACEVVG